MALYLAIHRPRKGGPATGPWKEYLETLPSSFKPFHPLTWTNAPVWKDLVALLTPGAKRKLDEVVEPWERDLTVLTRVVKDEPIWEDFGDDEEMEILSSWRRWKREELVDDLQWAWLNGMSAFHHRPMTKASSVLPHSQYP
jgi:hypothetical protein